ncbi:hypothetical protein KEM60_00238 [Austwickia sp. TVS 96-490-7B]|nr:hypothetical protein [Austwickia sp. TVS 96-490-7B]
MWAFAEPSGPCGCLPDCVGVCRSALVFAGPWSRRTCPVRPTQKPARGRVWWVVSWGFVSKCRPWAGLLGWDVARGRVWWVVSWGFVSKCRPWAGLLGWDVARGRVWWVVSWGFVSKCRPWAGLLGGDVARGRVWRVVSWGFVSKCRPWAGLVGVWGWCRLWRHGQALWRHGQALWTRTGPRSSTRSGACQDEGVRRSSRGSRRGGMRYGDGVGGGEHGLAEGIPAVGVVHEGVDGEGEAVVDAGDAAVMAGGWGDA